MAGRWEDPTAIREFEVQLGAQIRGARQVRGLTQLEVADVANTSVGALKNLESGRGANIRTLIRVLLALGIEDWLNTLHVPRPTFNPLDLPAIGGNAGQRTRAADAVSGVTETEPDRGSAGT